MAMAMAMARIRDGQGKVKDYVNFFKNTGISKSQADEQGLTARALGKKSYAIASNGSDSLIAAHRSNDLSDDGAVAIADAAPGDERLQALGIRAIQEGKTIAQAGNLVRAVKLMASERPENTGDMFGFDDSGMREAEAMAKAATTHQRDLQNRINAISGAAKRPDIAKQEGIKVGDSAAILRRVDELKAEKSAWDKWPTNPELVAKIRSDLAAEKPALDSYTPAEAAAKEAREAQATRAEGKAASDGQAKLKADAEVGDFDLTGSDRTADADKNQDAMFSVRDKEHDALRELSEHDSLYAIGKSDKNTVQGIAADVAPTIKVKRYDPWMGRTDYQLTLPDGNIGKMVVREPNPYGPSTYDHSDPSNPVTERPGG